MRRLVFLLSFAMLTKATYSQNQLFKKGDLNAQFGVGFLSPVLMSVSHYDAKSTVPPLSATFDFGMTEAISAGAYVGLAKTAVYSQKYSEIGQDEENLYGKIGAFRHLIIGVRGLYHYELSPKLDTYLGAMIGYNTIKVTESQVRSEIGYRLNGLTYNVMLGGRMPLRENLGAFLEIGYGVSVINLGLNVKLQ